MTFADTAAILVDPDTKVDEERDLQDKDNQSVDKLDEVIVHRSGK